MSGEKRIGTGLMAGGAALQGLGVMFMFSWTFLALGGICLVAGFVYALGPARAMSFFVHKPKGSACFLGGLAFIILFGKSFIGFVVEVIGVAMLVRKMYKNIKENPGQIMDIFDQNAESSED